MSEITAESIRGLLGEIMRAPKNEPDTLIVDPFYYDTLKAEMDVHNRFAGRNWRRIKRERRKAHDLVKWKHQNKGRVMFAIDSQAAGLNWWRSPRTINIGEW